MSTRRSSRRASRPPAGGGTTGATQGNSQVLAQLRTLRDAYAGTGPWAYGSSPNPFPLSWATELALPPIH